MKKIWKKAVRAALAACVLVGAASALAATTWAPLTTNVPIYARASKGTFDAASGTDPLLATTTTGAPYGLELKNVSGLSVSVETTNGSNMTAGGKFLAYWWNPSTTKWERVADGSLDLVTSAVANQAWSGMQVTADVGRIAWEPSGVGTATSLYVFGTSRVFTPR